MMDLTITALHRAYERGTTPAEVVAACRARLAAVDDPGIFIALVPEARVAEMIAALGPFDPVSKPLWGIPFAIKDNIDLAGVPTTAACPAFAYTPGEDAGAIARLVAAGAIPLGKTNLDQFATGLVGTRTPYPIPRNAIDPVLIPGGSSSGSAVAVAQGIVTFALGTDTAGSGRVPAALNEIVGLKPSLGLVSTRGVVPACRTLDCVSVFAMGVRDAWRVHDVMAGFDAADAQSRRFPAPRLDAPARPRFGVPRPHQREFFGDAMAESAFTAHLERLAQHGTLVEVDVEPLLETARLLYGGPWVAERYAAIRPFFDAHEDDVHPVTRRIVGGARTLSAADTFTAMYRLAELRRAAEPMWNDMDALVLPTMPAAYTVAQLLADPVTLNTRLGTYTNFVNLLDLCALAVPGPRRADKWPAGITFIAPAGRDGMLALFGAAFTGETLQPAPDDRVDLVVVGAHMGGLPLNAELLALGGRFGRAVTTTADYRLYELAGGPVRRPGLLRVAEGAGAGIAAEIWSLEAAAFGRFVAGVVPPLAIGTLHLSDGSTAKGFLVESEGLRGAVDITAHGGWRAWLAAGKAA